MIPINRITGVVLAGGRGSRMGGLDKGLQNHLGRPLVQHARQRLSPQVGNMSINANRHTDVYASFGGPVWPDATRNYAGPLAGFLAGLTHCETPYLVTVPCDTPHFPTDLVARLATDMVAHNAPMAMAATHGVAGVQLQPVFCLMATSVKASLAAFLQTGQRKVEHFAALHGCVQVVFEDESAFANANTADELEALQQLRPDRPG